MNDVINKAEMYLGAGRGTKAELVGFYNANCVKLVKPDRRYQMKLSDNWCAMFTSVVALKVGLSWFPYEVSVREQVKLARERGAYLPSDSPDVQIGDLIIYDWGQNGNYNHVGFVSDIDEFSIHTIEGNYSNTVKRRSIKRSSRAVAGFISLGAELVGVEFERVKQLVAGVMLGEFGNGEERKERLGADYQQVQAMVNKLI